MLQFAALSLLPSRRTPGWSLHILILLVGVLVMHLWISPSSDDAALSAYDVPIVSAAEVAFFDATRSTSALTSPTGIIDATPATVTGTSVDRQELPSTSPCVSTCPTDHSMITAICLIAFLVIGAFSFLWLRRALIVIGTSWRGPPPLTLILRCRPQTVSLVRLSISRT